MNCKVFWWGFGLSVLLLSMLLAYGLSPRWHDSLLIPFGSDFGGRPAYVNLPVPLKIILGVTCE
jgi:hypothetical protein